MAKKDQFHIDIEMKYRDIMGNADILEKMALKESRAVIDGRRQNKFFHDVYSFLYGVEDLKRRPFLNIGPGSFRHSMWRTADKKYGEESAAWMEMRRGVKQDPVDYHWDIYSGLPMPEENGYFKLIYTSHVIEHLFPKDVDFLLREAWRLLEAGGTLRIVCPDAQQFADAYLSKDWSFFMQYLIAKTGRKSLSLNQVLEKDLQEVSASFIIEWVSLLTNEKNPVRLTPTECTEFLSKRSNILESFDKASILSSRSLNESVGGHVNWFNNEKLVRLLKMAGFEQVKVSGYLKSAVPSLRDQRLFDRTDPEMSLFIEAVK